MSGNPQILTVKAIRQLLNGNPANNDPIEAFGKYSEVISALNEAHEINGSAGVQQSLEALTIQYPDLKNAVYPFQNFNGFSAKELGTMDIPAPTYLVDGVIPEGCSLLVAAPKIGKTLFTLNVAYGIACGGIVLGNIPVTKARVLFLALEGSKRGLKRRLELLADGTVLPNNLHFFQQWENQDDGGYDLLAQWIDNYPDTGLIVIDTLKRIRGKGDSRRNLYDADYEALQPLAALSERTNIPIIVVHHTRKMDSNDPLDMVSGSHGLAGAVDNVLVMKRSRGQIDALLTVIPREEDEAELALKFDEHASTWILKGDAREVAKTLARQKIFDALKEAGKAMTPKQLAEVLGEKPNNIKQLCYQMKKSGELGQPADGHYYFHPLNNHNLDNPNNPSGY